MGSRHRRIDRSVREPQWTIRLVTLAILLAGGAVVTWAILRSEARRERALAGLEVGDTAARVVERLGQPPYVCPTGSLAHLEGHFPGGWPGAAQTRAIELLRDDTAERWVYPLDEAATNPCAAPATGSEVGVGPDGRVLWYIPVAGRFPLVLPPGYGPGSIVNDTL